MSEAIYGLLAEFSTAADLLAAAHRAREEGYVRMDAYSPYPVEGLTDALGFHHTRVPLIVLAGGVLGAIGGYLMQYYFAVIEYPFHVGGRPEHSWPSFIPVTFEMTILTAALYGLPMPYHPVFNVPRFARASRDRFFLCIETADPRFDRERTADFLRGLGAAEVSEVPP